MTSELPVHYSTTGTLHPPLDHTIQEFVFFLAQQLLATATKCWLMWLVEYNVDSFAGCRQHYPGASCPDAALRLDKMLWVSEEYSSYNDVHGGGCWARVS